MPAYSRGKGKDGYRRDLEELRRRGSRERPDPSPSYEAEIEERAIRRRAEAWTRIATHFAEQGDREAFEAIRDYVADHYDYRPDPGSGSRPDPGPGPEKAPVPQGTPAPTNRQRPRDQGRER
jgi:hypothetical protein